jgi:hypothetical protein
MNRPRSYTIWPAWSPSGGVVYLVLWLYGLVIDHGSAANFVPVNGADDWLHLVLGVGMIGLGVALRRVPAARRTA